MKPKAAAIYVRISKDPTGARAGVERQRKDCERRAAKLGWKVAEVYEDNDKTAYRGKPRPAYQRMLNDFESAERDGLIAWHPDRLHRDLKELEEFIDLIEATGVHLEMVETGSYDLTTSDGRFVARTLGNVAKKSSEDTARRIRRAIQDRAEEGRPHGGGHRATGYEADGITLVPHEAEMIRDAADRIIARESLRSICTDWNARAFGTVTGGEWEPSALRRILTSWRIAGKSDNNGKVFDAVWPAIIDVETLETVRSVIDEYKRAHESRKSPARRYLMTGGLARCGLDDCGAALIARPYGDGRRDLDGYSRRAYACAGGVGRKGCGKLKQLAEPFEDLIRDAVLLRLESPAVLRALRHGPKDDDGRNRKLTAELHRYETRLDRLKHEYAVEDMWSKRDFKTRREVLEQRIDQIRDRLASGSERRIARDVPSGKRAMRKWWDAASIEQRRALLDAMLVRVDLLPAIQGDNRFQPKRVNPIWRDGVSD